MGAKVRKAGGVTTPERTRAPAEVLRPAATVTRIGRSPDAGDLARVRARNEALQREELAQIAEEIEPTTVAEGSTVPPGWHPVSPKRSAEQLANVTRYREQMLPAAKAALDAERVATSAFVADGVRAGLVILSPRGTLDVVSVVVHGETWASDTPHAPEEGPQVGDTPHALATELRRVIDTEEGRRAAFEAHGLKWGTTAPSLVLELEELIPCLEQVRRGSAPEPFISLAQHLVAEWAVSGVTRN